MEPSVSTILFWTIFWTVIGIPVFLILLPVVELKKKTLKNVKLLEIDKRVVSHQTIEFWHLYLSNGVRITVVNKTNVLLGKTSKAVMDIHSNAIPGHVYNIEIGGIECGLIWLYPNVYSLLPC